jgi:CBS domain-containing protein
VEEGRDDMAEQIRDVMTEDLVALPVDATVVEASREMDRRDIGDVLVVDGKRLVGMLTDRDIVVRAVAQGRDPNEIRIGDVATTDIQTLAPDADLGEAVAIMRQAAVRRVPVVDGERPIGIVSIGDLAIEADGGSALAEISAAEPNE